MNSEIIYFCLMLLGWFFLAGWTVGLVAACAVVFREAGEEERCPRPVFKKASSRFT